MLSCIRPKEVGRPLGSIMELFSFGPSFLCGSIMELFGIEMDSRREAGPNRQGSIMELFSFRCARLWGSIMELTFHGSIMEPFVIWCRSGERIGGSTGFHHGTFYHQGGFEARR